MAAADLAIEWMDYDTLARRFGIERESARQKAKRGRWARRRDNAGGWQVGVPVEVLQEHPVRDHATGDRDHDRVQDDANVEMNADVNAFTRHIERLEQALETAQVRANGLQQQLDTARDEAATAEKARAAIAAQVEALNTVLAVERERLADERARVDEWKAVADRFALQAEALAARPSRFFGWFRRWASG
jgi:hypothetical protein